MRLLSHIFTLSLIKADDSSSETRSFEVVNASDYKDFNPKLINKKPMISQLKGDDLDSVTSSECDEAHNDNPRDISGLIREAMDDNSITSPSKHDKAHNDNPREIDLDLIQDAMESLIEPSVPKPFRESVKKLEIPKENSSFPEFQIFYLQVADVLDTILQKEKGFFNRFRNIKRDVNSDAVGTVISNLINQMNIEEATDVENVRVESKVPFFEAGINFQELCDSIINNLASIQRSNASWSSYFSYLMADNSPEITAMTDAFNKFNSEIKQPASITYSKLSNKKGDVIEMEFNKMSLRKLSKALENIVESLNTNENLSVKDRSTVLKFFSDLETFKSIADLVDEQASIEGMRKLAINLFLRRVAMNLPSGSPN